MSFLINMVAKFSGASYIWDKLDGFKLYATGVLAILGAVVGLGAELSPILAAHNTAGVIAFITHINSDPAYLALLAGFATIAAAHKADKMATPAGVPASPAPVVPPVQPPVAP